MQGETSSGNAKRRSNRFNLRNLPDTYTQDEVASFLTPFGKYSKMEVTIAADKSITVEVHYDSPEEATEAASKLSKEQVEGKTLKVDFVGNRSGGKNRQDNKGHGASGATHGLQQQMANRAANNNDFPLRILVPTEVVGAIIGRKGETIKQITQTSHARIDIHGRENTGQTPEKAITIYGTPENCTAACKEILKIIEQELKNDGANGEFVLKILAYNQLCGRLIGKGGVVIKQIMSETNTKITVSRQEWFAPGNVTATDRVITVKGDLDNMAQAESKISERLRACFENDTQAQAPMAPNQALNMFAPPFNLAHASGGPGGALSAAFPPNYASAPGNMQRFPQFPMAQPMQQPPNWYAPSAGPWAAPTGFQPQAAVSSSAMPNTAMVMSGGAPSAVNQIAGQSGSNVQHAGTTQNGQSSQWPPTEAVNLYIPNLAVGAIIGQKGSYIRKIIQLSKASIKVAPLPKQAEEAAANGENANTNRERIVTITGTPEAQWNAQFYIFDKIKTEGFCGNDDPRLMTEITVPKTKVGRIIGKGGRKVREIQQLSAAVVKLPEQPSDQGEDVKIQIIGNFYANQTAQRFVRALCSANQLPNSAMPLTGPAPPVTAGPQSSGAVSYTAAGPRNQQVGQQGRMMSGPHQQQGVVGPLSQAQAVNLNGAMPMPPSFGSMVPPALNHPYQGGLQPYGPPHYQQQHIGSFQAHHGQAPHSSQYGHGGGHQNSVHQYHHGGAGGGKQSGNQGRGNRGNHNKAGLVVPPPGTVLSNNSNGNSTSNKDKQDNGASNGGSNQVNGNAPVSENVSNDGESTNNEAVNENGSNGSPTGTEDAGAVEIVPTTPAPIPVAVEGGN